MPNATKKKNADVSGKPRPKDDDKISLRQFAAFVGVDYESARLALENGRINFEPGTRLLVWGRNRDLFQDTRTHRFQVDDTGAKVPAGMSALGQAKYRKENAAAELKELELHAQLGRVLEKDAVRKAMFDWARNVRDAVLTIPDRVASEIASQINAQIKDPKKATDAEVERVVREAWVKESIAVLETVDAVPEVKPPKRKSNAEESDD